MCLGINGVKMWDVYRVSRKGVCSSCTAVNSAALSVHITKLELQHVACTALDFQLQCSGCQVKGEAELHASTHTSNVAPYSSYLGFHISSPCFHISYLGFNTSSFPIFLPSWALIFPQVFISFIFPTYFHHETIIYLLGFYISVSSLHHQHQHLKKGAYI